MSEELHTLVGNPQPYPQCGECNELVSYVHLTDKCACCGLPDYNYPCKHLFRRENNASGEKGSSVVVESGK